MGRLIEWNPTTPEFAGKPRSAVPQGPNPVDFIAFMARLKSRPFKTRALSVYGATEFVPFQNKGLIRGLS
jgi:hypothetical protein